MKKITVFFMAIIASCTIMTSCSVNSPVCATSNPVGHKKGEVKQQFVLGFAWNNNGGIEEAAQKAGITKISHVEVKTQPFYPIVGKKKIVVYGE